MDKPSASLLQDRPALKLYACQQHLDKLRNISQAEGQVRIATSGFEGSNSEELMPDKD